MQTYVDVTQDYKFVEEILPSLDREFEYWEKKKTVNVPFKGKNYVMARYYVEDEGPRPESYRYLLSAFTTFENLILIS